ncbi:hypothetical protein [uncultured Ruminococcus sp.]|uniref:hypothetical protein n=1 Tax=uncultured Ruminococcus sp. TaxID=165186 RepID=UPI00262E7E2B|nr:hypothetical protein [uncultured Ruminococcus sp.]
MNNKHYSVTLFASALIFLIGAVLPAYRNIPFLLEEPQSISEVLDSPEKGQAVEWVPIAGMSSKITTSKGLFGTGLFKTYLYGAAVKNGDTKDMVIVRGTKHFGEMFDPETHLNDRNKTVRGNMMPMSSSMKTAVAPIGDMVKEHGYAFGDGWYVDTMLRYKAVIRLISAAVFLLLAVITAVRGFAERRREREGRFRERVSVLDRVTLAVIVCDMIVMYIAGRVI